MKIEKVKLVDLKPLETNVRKHGEKQIEELVRSLKQFGQTRLMVIDEDNNILIGNGMFMAMQKMGVDDIECHRVNGLSEKQKKKLVLSDNRVYSLGSDDYDNIQKYIDEITVDGDFDIAGYDDEVLRDMVRDVEQIADDVMNYGVVTEGAIKQPQAIPTPAPASVVQSSEDTQSESVTETQSEQQDVSGTPMQQEYPADEERATVICPSCGEVIYLD